MKAEIEWKKLSDSYPRYTSRILVLCRTANDQWRMRLLLYYAPDDEFTEDGRYFFMSQKEVVYWAYFPDTPKYC
jgi:hypothetical protein